MAGKSRGRGGLFVGSLGLLGLLATGASCGDDQVFFISQNQAPYVVGEECKANATKGQPLTSGTLDVFLDHPRGYFMYPVIEHPRGDAVVVDRLSVVIKPDPRITPKIQFPAECPPAFEWPTTVRLEAGAILPHGALPALLPCHAQVIKDAFENTNPARATYPTDQLVSIFYTAELRMVGRGGDRPVASDVFSFPIRVCYGCLQVGAPDRVLTPACSTVVTNPYKGNPCNLAQDYGPFMCCFDDSAGFVDIICPAPDRR